MIPLRKTVTILLGAFAVLVGYVVLFEDSTAGPVLLLIASVAGAYFVWPKEQSGEPSEKDSPAAPA